MTDRSEFVPGRRAAPRVPPFNISAEESLIGAVLLDPEALNATIREVLPGDFYKPAHQHVWTAAGNLWSTGQRVDAVTVAERLRQTGLLDDVGGLRKLLELQAATPTISNAARYGRIIAECAARRDIIAAAGDIAEMAYREGPDQTSAGVLDAARHRLSGVTAAAGQVPADLMAVEEFMERPKDEVLRPWVIPGTLRQAHRVIIVGPEGRGKGVLLRQVAMAISQGCHPFAPVVRFAPQRTLYIDLENPPEAVWHQIELSKPALERVNGGWVPGMAWLLARESGMDLRSRPAQAEIEAVMSRVRPQCLVVGPVYKAFRRRNGEGWSEAAEAALEFLDDIRIRYSCAIWLEAHAAKGSAGHRDMDPAGSQQWMAAPEVGLGMVPDGDKGDRWGKVKLQPFRGFRVPGNWPTHLFRRGADQLASSALPWVGHWEHGGSPTANDDEMF